MTAGGLSDDGSYGVSREFNTVEDFLRLTKRGRQMGGVVKGDRPDVTAAQIVGLAQAALAVAVAFGLDLSDVQVASLMGLSAVIAGMLFHSDKGIREARNYNPPDMSLELEEVE